MWIPQYKYISTIERSKVQYKDLIGSNNNISWLLTRQTKHKPFSDFLYITYEWVGIYIVIKYISWVNNCILYNYLNIKHLT